VNPVFARYEQQFEPAYEPQAQWWQLFRANKYLILGGRQYILVCLYRCELRSSPTLLQSWYSVILYKIMRFFEGSYRQPMSYDLRVQIFYKCTCLVPGLQDLRRINVIFSFLEVTSS